MKKFIKQFTNEKIMDKKDHVKINNRIYLTKEKEFPIEPFSTGLFLGEKKKYFVPSFPLLEMIQPHTDKKVIVNEKSAWLFVCGRDILKEGVIEGEPEDKEVVLVLNEQEECLGYGQWKRGVLKNRLDIGDFLRRER